jgi:pyruvate, water dikinase
MTSHVLWLHQLRLSDLAQVGGKNSSLGEMIGQLGGLGVSVPGGFATTASAFAEFIGFNNLTQRIYARLDGLDVENVDTLTQAGREIREWVVTAPLQPVLEQAVREAYAQLCRDAGSNDIAVAVRSSATAEDLPDASFAGQQ